MNYLVLMVGAPGIGKSTVIDWRGWGPYTICPDNLRLQHQSPVLQPNGNLTITGNNDRVVWESVMSLLEFRMKNGDFTVIDATHTKESYFPKYKKLAEKYGYRMFAIDMINFATLGVCLERNEKRLDDPRTEHKYVPPEVIERMYEQHQNLNIPKYVTRIDGSNEQEIKKHLSYKIHDYDSYDGITVIGDIHGCIDPLRKFPDLSLKNRLYIFVGDYVDRGVDNGAVMKYILEVSKLDNVVMLEGNHEIHLQKWANGETSRSSEFNNFTAPQLESANISKSEVRQWYRKLVPVEYFVFSNKHYLVTHGGLSCEPRELLYVANSTFIKGTGRYEDMLEVNEAFLKNTYQSLIQIHGHRNITKSPTQINERCYNLEGQVEFGGHLRLLHLEKGKNPRVEEIPNTTVKPNIIPLSQFNPAENKQIISQLISSRDIKTSIQESNPNIVSFNFTKNVFYKQRWDDFNVKARGLFVNINTGKVVARSYNKFFNLGERPETKLPAVLDNFTYPVKVFKKENGFLGLIGYDEELNKPIMTSKSLIDGEYAKIFSDALLLKVRQFNIDPMRFQSKVVNFMKDTGYGLVLEVIEPHKDPHIISEFGIRIVLLAAINLDFSFKQLPYSELLNLEKELGFSVKHLEYTAHTKEQLKKFIEQIYKTSPLHEGFVFEGANNFMVKFKTPYYNFWKQMRTQVQRYAKHQTVNYDIKYNGDYETADNFLTWVRQNYFPPDLENNINIPKLRSEWIQYQNL
jgi:predicted kinase